MKLDQIALSALGIALCSYFGYNYLDELDISYNQIGPEGIKCLNYALLVNIGINVNKLNIAGNHIDEAGRD